MYFRIWPKLRCETKLKTGQSGQYQAEWTMRFHKRHNYFLDPLSYISYKLILVTFQLSYRLSTKVLTLHSNSLNTPTERIKH